LKDFSVNILGLSQKTHQFSFHLDNAFFDAYKNSLVTKGDFQTALALDKHETFIEAQFKIQGVAELICDRSLESFEFLIDLNEKIIFKYGEEEGELSEEIVVITRDRVSIDFGQYLHEFITLAIPMKKLHPKYQESDDDSNEGQLVYTSAPSNVDDDLVEPVDPRWEKLKTVTIKK